MAKKKAAPQHVEPEDASQEPPDDEPARVIEPAPKAGAKPTASKADACRAALAEGIETTEEAVSFAKSRFGIDIKPTDFSLYKSKSKRQVAGAPKRRPGRKPKAVSQDTDGYPAAPPPHAATGESSLLSAMEAMKPLVASLGKEQVKRIVDLLG